MSSMDRALAQREREGKTPKICCELLGGLVNDSWGSPVWLSEDGQWHFPVDFSSGPTDFVKFCPYCGVRLELDS